MRRLQIHKELSNLLKISSMEQMLAVRYRVPMADCCLFFSKLGLRSSSVCVLIMTSTVVTVSTRGGNHKLRENI